MCDDVSANKSLNGNERETPSTRSQLNPHARSLSVMAWAVYGRGKRIPSVLALRSLVSGGSRPVRAVIGGGAWGTRVGDGAWAARVEDGAWGRRVGTARGDGAWRAACRGVTGGWPEWAPSGRSGRRGRVSLGGQCGRRRRVSFGVEVPLVSFYDVRCAIDS
jgi:hypothetical protein